MSLLTVNDASTKTNIGRANYFLKLDNQASTQYGHTNLFEKVKSFYERGGKLLFVPLKDEDRVKDKFIFAIKTNDELFPVCPDGFHRSQILYLVLKGIKRLLGVSTGVNLPHGAKSGYDPWIMEDNPEDKKLQYTHLPADYYPKTMDAFAQAFGFKSVRFGQDTSGNADLTLRPSMSAPERSTVSKHRTRMREYFDLYYYQLKNKVKQPGRLIFFVCGSALPIVIDRLCEVNLRANIAKILVVALPFGVEQLEGGKPDTFISLYKTFASLFKPVSEP